MGFLDRASCADPNACVGVLEEGHCVCYSDRLAQPARAVERPTRCGAPGEAQLRRPRVDGGARVRAESS